MHRVTKRCVDFLSGIYTQLLPKKPFFSEDEKQQLKQIPSTFRFNFILGGSLSLLQEVTTRILEDEFIFLEYGDAFTWAIHYGFHYAVPPAVDTVVTALLKPNFQGHPIAKLAWSTAIHSICGYALAKEERAIKRRVTLPRPVWDQWWPVSNKVAPLTRSIAPLIPTSISAQGIFARDICAGCIGTLGWSFATMKPKGRSAVVQFLMDFPIVMFDNAVIAGARYGLSRIAPS
jgi:hypothetical protein